MELETLLLNAMLEAGASSSLARIHAADFAAVVKPKIDREKRNQAIRDLFPQLGWRGICDRFGVGSSTAYRAMHFSHELPTFDKGTA